VNPSAARATKLLTIWLLVALFFSTQNVLVRTSRGAAIDWQWDVFHEFLYWLVWAGLTPLILRTAERHRLEAGRMPALVVPHLLLMLVVGPLSIGATYTLHVLALRTVGALPPGETVRWLAGKRPGFVWGTLAGFLYYWLIVGVFYAFTYQRLYRAEKLAAAELEARLAQARLEALRTQLHPHFLFNTLNAISVLTSEDAPKANRMLLRLSDLLRLTLDTGGRHEVTLGEELDFLERYLEIQRIRFEDRLTIMVDVAPATRAARVPTLILQPLVENAIRHGVDSHVAGGTIVISARRRGDALELEVRDNGRGLAAAPADDGIGLANTRARLAQLYGECQRLELRAQATGGAAVVVTLPFRASA
jgi:two-component system LytT family sensor kinase